MIYVDVLFPGSKVIRALGLALGVDLWPLQLLLVKTGRATVSGKASTSAIYVSSKLKMLWSACVDTYSGMVDGSYKSV